MGERITEGVEQKFSPEVSAFVSRFVRDFYLNFPDADGFVMNAMVTGDHGNSRFVGTFQTTHPTEAGRQFKVFNERIDVPVIE